MQGKSELLQRVNSGAHGINILGARICMDAAADRFPPSWEPSHRPLLGGSAGDDTAGSGGGSSQPTDSAREPAASRDGAASLSSNIFRAGIRGALREVGMAANATLTNLDSQETAAAAAERHRHRPYLPVLAVMLIPAAFIGAVLPEYCLEAVAKRSIQASPMQALVCGRH